jgi:methyl-accepting chemotaxis protein
MNDLKQRIDKVEECADEANEALMAGSAPEPLRESVQQLHQQARQAKQMCASGGNEQQMQGQVRDAVLQLEQTADRAMQACRQGGNVSPQLQQAVQKVHAEASSLKKQVQMG